MDDPAPQVGKTKAEYSRNVKKLKLKLHLIAQEIYSLQQSIHAIKRTSNDQLVALKIARFCKERRFTPEMLFRFADREGKGVVQKTHLHSTFLRIGLKLSSEQLMRLQYLMDEDLSGTVSLKEYLTYLHAFGIKKEYDSNAANEVDLNKILAGLDNLQDSKEKKESRAKNLLSYEELLKYCHRHFPELKDKDIASIFNRLERSYKIDLQDFLDYLHDLKGRKKKLEEENIKKAKPIQKTEATSIRGIILELLRGSHKDQLTFSSAQFKRLQRNLKKQEGELMGLFRDMDVRKRGLIGYNQLINCLIEKEPRSAGFAFELMGKKINGQGQKAENIVAQYTLNAETITDTELTKLLKTEFQVKDSCVLPLASMVPHKDGVMTIECLLELMASKELGGRKCYIAPRLGKIDSKLMLTPESSLMTYCAEYALLMCLSITEQMGPNKVPWSDPEFGPTETDESGRESLQLPISFQHPQWIRVADLGMVEFAPKDYSVTQIASSTACPHQLLARSLQTVLSVRNSLCWQDKIDYSIREVGEDNLRFLFSGLYPLAFHRFASCGIYVFKFFLSDRWVYVLVDDQLPCSPDSLPLFLHVADCKYAWISLLEKAYAKLKGSYRGIFQSTIPYSTELARSVPIERPIKGESQQQLWNALLQANKLEKRIYCVVKQEGGGIIRREQMSTGLMKGREMRVAAAIQVGQRQKSGRPHELAIMEATAENEAVWNSRWSKGEQNNEFDKCETEIRNKITGKSLHDMLLLEVKMLMSIFDTVVEYREVNFQARPVLRKQIEFQEKFKCQYKIQAEQQCSIGVIIRKKRAPQSDKVALEVSWSGKRQTKSIMKGAYLAQEVKAGKGEQVVIELSVENWSAEEHIYVLTYYMSHAKYSLKERDRHLPFSCVNATHEEPKWDFDRFDDKVKKEIIKQFYRGAERRGCCGCL